MGHLKRQRFTAAVPAGAEIIERKGGRVARWRGRDGRIRTAPVSADGARVTETASTWTAYWTDAEGRRRSESTGMRDKQAAQAWLAARERETELARAGVVSTAERRTGKAADISLAQHVGEYTAALEGRGRTAHHVAATRRYLDTGAAECGFHRLADVERDVFERFLVY